MVKQIIENSSMFLRAYVLIFLIDIGLRSFGFHQVARTLLKWQKSTGSKEAEIDWEKISKTVNIAKKSFRLYIRRRIECLERSLVVYSLLRREGIPAQLCLGCSKYPPLTFHAWVECDGRVVNDGDLVKERYVKVSVK